MAASFAPSRTESCWRQWARLHRPVPRRRRRRSCRCCSVEPSSCMTHACETQPCSENMGRPRCRGASSCAHDECSRQPLHRCERQSVHLYAFRGEGVRWANLAGRDRRVQWPNAPDFKNDALWAFGSPAASSLYVWSVGTHPMCLQYADTLMALADSGFWVLCPAISFEFSIAEWVLKSVVAVDWAMAKGQFSKIMLGGHSGGGPVALSSGYILAQRKLTEVSAFVLQHPGAVSSLNVPGCASHTRSQDKASCERFFPADMLGHLKGPILVTCGTFCGVTKAQNSNFFHGFSCNKAHGSGTCLQTWAPPSASPLVVAQAGANRTVPAEDMLQNGWQFEGSESWRRRDAAQNEPGVVTCEEGYCTNGPWLQNPSDCMIDTVCEDVFNTFVRPTHPIAPPLGEGVLYKHCGEHEFSVMGPYGWKQEGLPAVRPFLKAAATGDKKEMTTMQGIDGQEQTCWMQKRPGDSSLKLESMDQAKMRYMSLSDHSPWVSATDKVEVVIAVIA
mmetsp:Transcript_139639/g.445631  ORF Transcript_139639/g.445631 Transcript_139639/m.445631 type:complete len:504 (-) Transcript_139639:61-1572(-)